MLRRSFALRSLLAAAVVVVGCQEPTTSPASAPIAPTAPSRVLSAARPAPLAVASSAPSVDRLFGEFGRRAINPGDYVCSDESPVIDVLYGEIDRTLAAGPAERERLLTLADLAADLVPTYEALFFQTTATPQTFGYDGEFTKIMTKTERDVKRFWDIPSSEIQVLGIHGTMLLDQERTYRTYRLLNFPDGIAASYAHRAADALGASTAMHGGNYVYFTYGSASYREAGLPDKIVIGDGILEAYAAIGYGDVAPQAILAHEYAHQIQYENGYFHDLGAVAQNDIIRYTELMADAMAGYYLTHKRGAALNAKRVVRFLETFHQIGDCAGTKNVLHGTQDQRVAAGEFGVTVAKEARKQGHILSSAQFHDLFLAYYPTLIASTP